MLQQGTTHPNNSNALAIFRKTKSCHVITHISFWDEEMAKYGDAPDRNYITKSYFTETMASYSPHFQLAHCLSIVFGVYIFWSTYNCLLFSSHQVNPLSGFLESPAQFSDILKTDELNSEGLERAICAAARGMGDWEWPAIRSLPAFAIPKRRLCVKSHWLRPKHIPLFFCCCFVLLTTINSKLKYFVFLTEHVQTFSTDMREATM